MVISLNTVLTVTAGFW